MRVLLASPWIPAEWVRAHGLATGGIWFAEEFRLRPPPLSAGNCAFSENVAQFAESQAAAVVFPTSCDQMRRAFDAVNYRGVAKVFLFNLPATSTPAARRIFRAELERLGEFLRELGGVAPTPERLRAETVAAERSRCALRTAAPAAEGRSLAQALARFWTDGGFSAPTPALAQAGLPLAVLGGPLSLADWPLFDVIEAAGGSVVLNATDAGERCLCPFPSALADPLAALADGYLDHLTDVFQRPNSRFYAWLRDRLAARHVRGVVLWTLTCCDLWRAEWYTLRESFGLPVLLLETDEAAGLAARDVGRLQAFVETLK
jgi:benzoyl-CoA reductase/2-hydroxyglutaryl-CoA dehydratase subunit BcrC/BadD/HgdB